MEVEVLKEKYREAERYKENRNMDNKWPYDLASKIMDSTWWFYSLATDVDTMVYELNEGLGDDIYYTVWNTTDCAVEIRDSRDDKVSHVWALEYWRASTKDNIRAQFDKIINDLKCYYEVRASLRKAKEDRMTDYNKMDERKADYNKMDYSTIKAKGAINFSTIATSSAELDWSVASIAAKGLYSHYATPVWKKVKGQIDRVIFNDPATIILWKSGAKTVVKCGPNEQFDKEKGLAMALCKYILGNKGNYNEFFKAFE